MSYDLSFWNQPADHDRAPREIYAMLCEEVTVERLAELPIKEIRSRVHAAFPAFDAEDEEPTIDYPDGLMEASWSTQHFRLDFRGGVEPEIANRIIDIMGSFGCALYDPQEDHRFEVSRDG